ncbi:hypothetical protein HDE_10861 [Halotydeus destructor]|nr:hypothetical protein HDE_10861 [Halotydeus destructor]
MFTFVLLLALSATFHLTSCCTVNSDCSYDQICGYSPVSYNYVCMATKPLQETCVIDQQCQGKVANSECVRQYGDTSRICKCKSSFNEIGGKCVADDHCYTDSDCSGQLFKTCVSNRCASKLAIQTYLDG